MNDLEKLKKTIKDHEKRISKLESMITESSGKSKKTTGKRKSIIDLFVELKDSKFFNKPQFLNQIVDKLAEMGYHYSASSLTEPLQRAVRQRILGRIKKDGKWAYVSR